MQNYFSVFRRLQTFVVLLSLTLVFLLLCTVKQAPAAQVPVFSAESGLYEDCFYLTLSAPEGCAVYYTTDGSTPDVHANRYREPIYIDRASLCENTNSMRTGMSPINDQNPDFLIDKCTVIRAVAIPEPGAKLEPSAVVTKSYFVGFPEGYFDNCAVLSLVTDEENLFDHETGIYVTGKKMEDYQKTPYVQEEPIYYWDANYWQKGREWEREANLTFLDAEGNLILSKDGGIRIQGGASRAYVPRSLNLFAREAYDGEGCFSVDFFDNGYQAEILTLTVTGNQLVTRFNDYFMSQSVGDTVYAVMQYRPYVLFLNGEYWGFYWLTEKYDAPYIRHRYQLPDADIIMVKNDEIAEGQDEDYRVYSRMVSYITSNDMSDPDYYAEACRLVDMDRYIDYYATMIYIARSLDWPGYNEAMWRTRHISEEPYADGKWRWMMFDCNSDCMTENLIEHDTLSYVIEWCPMFASLWENTEFRSAFEERIFQVADSCFEPTLVHERIQAYREQMLAPLTKTWARFYGRENTMSENYHATLDGIDQFFRSRRAVVEAWFA